MTDEKLCEDAGRIIEADAAGDEGWRVLGSGLRTRGVLAPAPGVSHRFGRGSTVVVKLYKGRGNPRAAATYRRYHGEAFGLLPEALGGLPIRKSIEAGLFEGEVPYAILEYIEGRPLREVIASDPARDRARALLRSLIFEIWIPLWDLGLRFKDCHPGNFLVVADQSLVMIDTEQMRYSAFEFLETPAEWKVRDKHEASGLRRLPGLIDSLAVEARHSHARAAIQRTVRQSITASGLFEAFGRLGRPDALSEARSEAESAAERLLSALSERGIL